MTEERKTDSRAVRLLRAHGLRLLGVGLLVWALSNVDLAKASEPLSRIGVEHLAAAAGCCVALILVRSLRWIYMLRRLSLPAAGPLEVSAYAHSMFLGTITPGRLGEFKRVWHLNRRYGLPLKRGTMVCLFERGIDVAVVAITATLMGALFPTVFGQIIPAWVCWVVALSCIGILLARRYLIRQIINVFSLSRRGGAWTTTAFEDVLSFAHGEVAVLGAFSVLSHAAHIGMVWVLVLPYGLELSPPQIVGTVGATFLAALVPISYLNLGPREVVLLTLFGLYGLTNEDAIGYSALFLICYLILMATSAAIEHIGKAFVTTPRDRP